MLLYLLVDLRRNAALKERFARQPESVLQEYGLAPAERLALMDPNLVTLHRALAAEAQIIINEMVVEHPGPLWPGRVQLIINDVQPQQATANTPTPVTIKTSWDRPVESSESQQAKMLLTFDAASSTVEASDVQFEATSSTEGTLRATVVFPTAGLFAAIVKVAGTSVKASTDSILSVRPEGR